MYSATNIWNKPFAKDIFERKCVRATTGHAFIIACTCIEKEVCHHDNGEEVHFGG